MTHVTEVLIKAKIFKFHAILEIATRFDHYVKSGGGGRLVNNFLLWPFLTLNAIQYPKVSLNTAINKCWDHRNVTSKLVLHGVPLWLLLCTYFDIKHFYSNFIEP